MEDLAKRIELMSVADIEKELRRTNLSPGYRQLLQSAMRERTASAGGDDKTPSLFGKR